MSLNITNLISKINSSTGANDTSYTVAKKLIDINLSLDDALAIIFSKGGTWQFDDGNHTADPIITTNLVDTQRDYHFTADEQSNVILDILKVMVADSAGKFSDLERVDMIRNAPTTMNDGVNSSGTPTKYALVGNGIFLDLIPNYNYTNGLKIYINREAAYFTVSDVTGGTMVAGIDGLCHDFLYLKPSYEWARNHNLANREVLYRDLQVSTEKIKDRYKVKEREVINKMTPNIEDNK